MCLYIGKLNLADRLVRDYVIDGSWNIGKLNLVLWPVDVVDITRMIVPHTGSQSEDSWSWFFEDSGCYTVKSGYRMLTQQDGETTTTRPFKWTKDLWKLKTQRKFIFLIWRIAQNILPTRATLFRRHISKESSCPFCDKEETSIHALLHCVGLQDFWAKFLPLPDNGVQLTSDPKGEWVSIIFSQLSNEKRIKFAAGLWATWTRRNKKVFQGYTGSMRQLHDSALFYTTERTTSAMEEDNVPATSPALLPTESGSIRTTPEVNSSNQFFLEDSSVNSARGTLQFDGVWRYATRNAGGGALVLDQFGNVRCAKARRFNWGNRAKEIEALSLEMGIDMAYECGITHLTVEGDAEILLDQTAGRNDINNFDRTVVKDIVDRIRQKSSFFTSICWKRISRDCNVRAHKLAERGLMLTDSQFWDSDFPGWLLPPPSGLV